MSLHPVMRRSELTGKLHTMNLPVTAQEAQDWQQDPNAPHVQDAFPNLTADEREFILTGITPDEWDELVGGSEDD